ncbi:hypothetical protein CYD53_11684 [Bosea psychrotolerans]|uniref:Uncharacterized protein n=2 Tax=Bosea psychrotolerans TaxID=1871628 RepID=A0A2S4M020_9HYPH|nr:hypothetical protein CYD53_11684 [Bosea psychrotolerans]
MPAKQRWNAKSGLFHSDGCNCMTIMSHWQAMALAAALSALPLASAAAQDGRRVTVTGEISDTWCTVSGLMFAKGTAHHQCAVWCALGGIPVSIRDAKGELYLILKIGDDEDSAANPRIARMATHEVAVDGELLERDGVKYLLVDRIADDKGVITMTHEEYGIQPFGN